MANDLTGQNIQNTYQRVLHVGDDGFMYDGTGSLYTPISASHEITTETSSSHALTADTVNSLTSVGVDGANNQLLTDNGDGTVTSETNIRWDGNNFNVGSSTSAKPTLVINNTNEDAEAPELILTKGTAGADGDDLGKVKFNGFDPNGNEHTFAQILGEIAVAADGSEEGRLTLSVASHDAEIQPGLIMASGNAEDEVDVTIGNGATSTTTIAGNFDATIDGGTW
tara:strand:- start:138 stop:812 length:675 start_codon:yes stop_codon:yes gene_type:complete